MTFPGLLQLLFIGLKLADIIDWSWWWVLSPLWAVLIYSFIQQVIIEILKAMK